MGGLSLSALRDLLWRIKASPAGFWGMLLIGALVAWRVVEAVSNIDFIAQNWGAIADFLRTYGFFAGLVVAGMMIAKAIYDTFTNKVSPPSTQPDAGTDGSAVTKRKEEYVQFGLPSNWQVGPGFKLVTLPEDGDAGDRDQAEEVRVFMRVKKKMQNAELEIRASRRRADGWETIAKITSPSLAGTVHKGKRENLPLMRRTFRMVSAQYDDPFLGTKQRINVRADKEVTIFPDDPAAFPAKLGEEYEFRIRIYHDEGPEQATVTVNLHQTLEVPQTRITSRENIEPVISGQLA